MNVPGCRAESDEKALGSFLTLLAMKRFQVPCDSLEGLRECRGEHVLGSDKISKSSSDTSQSSYASLEHTREMSVLLLCIDMMLPRFDSFPSLFAPLPFLSRSPAESSDMSGDLAFKSADIM